MSETSTMYEQLRTLACVKTKQRKTDERWVALTAPERQVVRWVRKHHKASDSRITKRLAYENAIYAMAEGCVALGLPDKISNNQPYTRYGLRWWRRWLARELIASNVTPEELAEISGLGTGLGWQYPMHYLQPLQTFGELAGEHSEYEQAKKVADVIGKIPGWENYRHYRHIKAMGQLAAVVRNQRGSLSLLDAIAVASVGLKATIDNEYDHLAAAAPFIQALHNDGDKAVLKRGEELARLVGDDGFKANLVVSSWAPKQYRENVKVATHIGKLGRHDAVVAYGSLADVARAHLGASDTALDVSSVTHAYGVPTWEASEHEDAVRAIRALSPVALRGAAALISAQGNDLASSSEAAVGLVACFGRGYAQFVKSASDLCERQTKKPLELRAAVGILPTGSSAREFGRWISSKSRIQALWRNPRGAAMLARIGTDFAELTDEERELPVATMFARLRARSYGPLGETALGQLGAELNISPQRLAPVAERWRKSLDVPTAFDITARYEDERSGLVGRFLPRTDPRGIYLGLLTDCCQYPDSVGAECAWAGHENPLHGFFVIEDDRGELIAQSWVWHDGSGRVCFDSIERKIAERGALLGADWGEYGEEWDDDDDVDYGDGETVTHDDKPLGKGKSKARKGPRVTPAQARAWATRRIYVQAAEALLGRAKVVTVGSCVTIPRDKLAQAKGNEVADPEGSGYSGYRDSRSQLVLAKRTGSGIVIVMGNKSGKNAGFSFQAGKKRIMVTAKNAHLTGANTEEIARELLAGMGARSWVVTRGKQTAVDPSGRDWSFIGVVGGAVVDEAAATADGNSDTSDVSTHDNEST